MTKIIQFQDRSKEIKRRERYERQIMKELEYESSIIDVDPHFYHDGTRLDRSRILETDEDNLSYDDY